MSSSQKHFSSLSALLRESLGDALLPSSETLLDMMTDDVVFEFPYALPGGIRRIEGKAALADYLPRFGELFTMESMALIRAILSDDGQHAVVEFSAKAHANDTGARYDQDYVSVIDLRNGRISRYRDYWNPLIVISATGGADKANAMLGRDDARAP